MPLDKPLMLGSKIASWNFLSKTPDDEKRLRKIFAEHTVSSLCGGLAHAESRLWDPLPACECAVNCHSISPRRRRWPDARLELARGATIFCWSESGLKAGERHRGKQEALEAELAIGGVVPFAEGVRSAAGAARSDGHRGNAKRERNIRVGGAALQARAIAQEAINIANGLEQRRIVGKRSGRPRAQGAEAAPVWNLSRSANRRLRLSRRPAWHRAARSPCGSAVFSSSERKSTLATALAGMELTDCPPSITPKLYEVRGLSGSRIAEKRTIPRAMAVMGLGTPKSDQLCPPGPVMVTSIRRDAMPCVVMCSAEGPSTAITALRRGP